MNVSAKALMPAFFLSCLWILPAAAQPDPAQPPADLGADTASHEEVEPLAIEFHRLSALRLCPDGNLLAGDVEAKQIKVIDPAGKLVRVIELDFGPEAIDVTAKGVVYCGGHGQLARLDKNGQVVTQVAVPEAAVSPISETSRQRAEKCDVALRLRVSGIAVSGRRVFVTFGSGWSTVSTSKLYCFNRDLADPKQLAEGLRGCCQRCDIIAAPKGGIYLAENSVHRVVRYNRRGKVLDKWGERNRNGVEGFGACCNPMNLCVDSEGTVYTSESGLGRVKRFSPEGEFLGLVGYTGVERFERGGPHAASCSNIAIAVTPEGDRVYVMDYTKNVIRVLQRKTM